MSLFSSLRKTLCVSLGLFCHSASASEPLAQAVDCAKAFNHSYKKLHSKDSIDLCAQTTEKVVLVVNTASSCGFTPQFEALEALHQKYKDQGLEIIGFPSDSFFQEHDDQAKTANVCYQNYGVTFTMVEPSTVRGAEANPTFKVLIEASKTSPKWNFYKYLVNRQGQVVQVYGSTTKPDDKNLTDQIEALL